MTSIVSKTPFPVQGWEHRFYHGNPYHCIAVKVSLQWDAEGRLATMQRQPEFALNDVWFGKEYLSSLLKASELIPFKPATEVVVTGSVRAPEGRPMQKWPIALGIGDRTKRLMVYGPRAWQHRLFDGWTLSAPQAVDSVALLYENAYGGTTGAAREHYADGEYYAENPAGCGFLGKTRADTSREYPAAQIETWNGTITKFGRDYPVGGLGPIPATAPSRFQHAGTWDEAWKKDMAPHIPLDMDMRYWNAAPPDQILDDYLKPGTRITLTGMRPGVPITLETPRIDAAVIARYADSRRQIQPMELDTIAIDLDKDCMSLRYHTILAFDKTIDRIDVLCALLPPRKG